MQKARWQEPPGLDLFPRLAGQAVVFIPQSVCSHNLMPGPFPLDLADLVGQQREALDFVDDLTCSVALRPILVSCAHVWNVAKIDKRWVFLGLV